MLLTPQGQSSERNLPGAIVQKLDNLNQTIWNYNFSLKNDLKLQNRSLGMILEFALSCMGQVTSSLNLAGLYLPPIG